MSSRVVRFSSTCVVGGVAFGEDVLNGHVFVDNEINNAVDRLTSCGVSSPKGFDDGF